MSQASDKALNAAHAERKTGPNKGVDVSTARILRAAHDPALGEEASIRFGDALDALRRKCDASPPQLRPRIVGLIYYLQDEQRAGRL
jgi:hypothetical protein